MIPKHCYLKYQTPQFLKKEENGNSQEEYSQLDRMVLLSTVTSVTTVEFQAVEKDRKAKNILLMAIPKRTYERFNGMDDAKGNLWKP
ncbi:hypothetical protein Tco_1103736 [Tanacetum coccineum]